MIQPRVVPVPLSRSTPPSCGTLNGADSVQFKLPGRRYEAPAYSIDCAAPVRISNTPGPFDDTATKARSAFVGCGSSAAGVHSKEQEQLNETVRYLMENLGYCGKCAFQALTITASSTSILD